MCATKKGTHRALAEHTAVSTKFSAAQPSTAKGDETNRRTLLRTGGVPGLGPDPKRPPFLEGSTAPFVSTSTASADEEEEEEPSALVPSGGVEG